MFKTNWRVLFNAVIFITVYNLCVYAFFEFFISIRYLFFNFIIKFRAAFWTMHPNSSILFVYEDSIHFIYLLIFSNTK
jgi:hypothetical protein